MVFQKDSSQALPKRQEKSNPETRLFAQSPLVQYSRAASLPRSASVGKAANARRACSLVMIHLFRMIRRTEDSHEHRAKAAEKSIFVKCADEKIDQIQQ